MDNINEIKLINNIGNFETAIREILLLNGKIDTYKHVTNVAKVNVEIARKFRLDEEVCKIAALGHDIAGIINSADMLTYIKRNKMFLDKSEEKYPFLLHQRLSAIMCNKIFNIRDERILSAINYHTTLKKNASNYDMALFVADKLAWDQEGQPPYYEIVKGELDKSLEYASLAYIKYVYDNNMILMPHKWLDEAKVWLEESIKKGEKVR
ncbi:putative HD superfamily hydrolase of NAD metabolism [Clostridium sp. DSM 8431]|uniref:bis(5'-nucleosyl)-tetraphosphatase (symmetrical) YqeK n=1 Tax=Clostridium sp. DSM 8431 TaxID=1761781 RepID=UPI0008E335A4|nr:bis(5'-nucleosyl)-tetraphosphatase (symmetrical) YqeK [Clostridium sp. DSM 8431]SFU66167.1 putative HD superfamily hydrolase of NAD metabolism [Clostridium sp. DSM 8431]